MAIYDYCKANGHFPPSYVADKAGRPLYSWRVLLLPYLDEAGLYGEFDLDAPWDSPHNRAVADKMPDVYRCPSDRRTDSNFTSYAMVIGPSMISDGSAAVTREDVSDGLKQTIIVVESVSKNIEWTAPEDLSFAQMSFRVNDREAESISSRHAGCANVLLCNGGTLCLQNDTDPKSVKALLSINGNEDVSRLLNDLY